MRELQAGSSFPFPKAVGLSNRVFAMIKVSSDIPGRIKVAFSYNAELYRQDQNGQGSPVASRGEILEFSKLQTGFEGNSFRLCRRRTRYRPILAGADITESKREIDRS